MWKRSLLLSVLLLSGCDKPKSEKTKYYDLGVECRKAGVPANANPGHYGSEKEQWIRGWIDGGKEKS